MGLGTSKLQANGSYSSVTPVPSSRQSTSSLQQQQPPQWTPVRLLPKDLTQTDLSLGKLPELQEATPLQSLLKLPTQALEELPCFSEDLLKPTMPSPTLSSTLGRLRARRLLQSTRSTG